MGIRRRHRLQTLGPASFKCDRAGVLGSHVERDPHQLGAGISLRSRPRVLVDGVEARSTDYVLPSLVQSKRLAGTNDDLRGFRRSDGNSGNNA
jgi:hypothetical protein